MVSLTPLITIFLSAVAFKTPIRLPQIIGAGFSMAGVLFLLSKGNLSQLYQLALNPGDGLILLASFLAAFYHIWVKKYGGNINNQHFTLLTNLLCLLCFILVLPFIPKTSPSALEPAFWLAAIAFGGIGTAFTYSLWNKGVKLAGAQKAGLYMNLVPLSTAGIAVFTGEDINFFHFISGSFILSGLFMSQLSKTNMSRVFRHLKGIKNRKTTNQT